MNRNLLLLRHVKSDWNHSALTDADRPINQERIEDLDLVARSFSHFQVNLDGIKCSTAIRTRQTADLFRNSMGQQGLSVDHESSLYLCSLQALRSVIASTSTLTKTLLIVGHNPALSEWLSHYSKNSEQHMPTSSLAWFSFFSAHWEISPATSLKLEWFGVPKRLRSFK